MKNNKFYTEKEIARKLRISLVTLGKLRKQTQIDFIKIGNSIRYPEHVYNGLMQRPDFMEGLGLNENK
jgi:hypothetical protein